MEHAGAHTPPIVLPPLDSVAAALGRERWRLERPGAEDDLAARFDRPDPPGVDEDPATERRLERALARLERALDTDPALARLLRGALSPDARPRALRDSRPGARLRLDLLHDTLKVPSCALDWSEDALATAAAHELMHGADAAELAHRLGLSGRQLALLLDASGGSPAAGVARVTGEIRAFRVELRAARAVGLSLDAPGSAGADDPRDPTCLMTEDTLRRLLARLHALRRDDAAFAREVEAALVDELAVRPALRWLGEALLDRPPADIVALQQDIAGVGRAGAGVGSGRPRLDAATAARVADAREHVLAFGAISDAWAWDEVRQAVSELGGTIPWVGPSPDDSTYAGATGAELAYDVLEVEVVVFPAHVRERTRAYLASVLVHEAVHVVFARRLGKLLGLEPAELNALLALCGDTDLAVRFASESLAYLDEAAWVAERDGEALLDAHPAAWFLRPALAHARGGAGAAAPYATVLRDFALEGSRAQGALRLRRPQARCGPPVVTRGPRRGEWLMPVEVAPEVLEALFAALER